MVWLPPESFVSPTVSASLALHERLVTSRGVRSRGREPSADSDEDGRPRPLPAAWHRARPGMHGILLRTRLIRAGFVLGAESIGQLPPFAAASRPLMTPARELARAE